LCPDRRNMGVTHELNIYIELKGQTIASRHADCVGGICCRMTTVAFRRLAANRHPMAENNIIVAGLIITEMTIIARKSFSPQPAPWQQELARGFRHPAELLSALGIPADHPALLFEDRAFPLRVPASFVRRMERGNPDDPLLNQVLPRKIEYHATPGYGADPVGDGQAMPIPGLLHKYSGRVLLVLTGACAIHCRYCFRRHFPYGSANPRNWNEALGYVAADSSIEEVILSGGDPLTLSDARLGNLVNRLEKIGHIKRLRIHTRLPVVLPARIDTDLLEWLTQYRLHKVMVIHANHPHEINHEVSVALARLKQAGATLLNQSVLLKGINDDAAVLADLSERLFDSGVLPYYLHQLDKVQGAAHFAVSDAQANDIHQKLMACLPGYLVPRLVREEAGTGYKEPVGLG